MKPGCALFIALAIAVHVAASDRPEALGDWPEFRGPTGQGIARHGAPPLEWGPSRNITWRVALPGAGWSSPVVYGGALYLTAATGDDPDAPENLCALRIDAASAEITWNVPVLPVPPGARKHPKNGYASPTPIVADDRVYVHFGPWGTACLDTAGTVLWRQTGLAYETPHGNGGSPVLHDGKLIVSCDDLKAPFVAALDADTGAVLWKTARETDASKTFSFCTPLVVARGDGHVVVSPGSGFVGAFDPDDGREVWRVDYGEGFSVVPRPVTAHGLVYVATGFARPCYVMAIRTGGTGDVTGSHVAWKSDEAAPHTPSMLVVGDELYYVSDRGTVSCVNARTGDVHWREEVGGRFSASPVYANGHIYVTAEDGTTTVFKADTTYTKQAENQLGERVFASPAVSGPTLFIRSEAALYRIEAK